MVISSLDALKKVFEEERNENEKGNYCNLNLRGNIISTTSIQAFTN